MITSNASEIRGVDEGMLDTLLLLMLEDPRRPGTVISRKAVEVVEIGGKMGAVADAGEEMKDKMMAREKMAKPPTAMLATETSAALQKSTRSVIIVATSTTKRCDAPDRGMYAVCGGNGYSAEICANIVTVFVGEVSTSGSDGDRFISGKDPYAFVCDAILSKRLVKWVVVRSLGR